MRFTGVQHAVAFIRRILSEAGSASGLDLERVAINPFPPVAADLAISLPYGNADDLARVVNALKATSMIQDVHRDRVFLNITLRRREFLKGFADNARDTLPNSRSSELIAIEHGSFTPAFPINLSTARIAIIGSALASLLKRSGSQVKEICWSDDKCRHLHLISKGLKLLKDNADPSSAVGKVDHFHGAAFFLGLRKERSTYDPEMIATLDRMFPYWRSALGANDSATTTLDHALLATSDECDVARRVSEGILASLRRLHVTQLECWDHTHFSSKNSGDDPPISSYRARSDALLASLLHSHSRVISVVSIRQQHALSHPAPLPGPQGDLVRFVWCGDVVYNDNLTDNITEGRFSSVDELLMAFSRFADDEITASAIRLLMLDGKQHAVRHLRGSIADLANQYARPLNNLRSLTGKRHRDAFIELCESCCNDSATIPDDLWRTMWLLSSWDYLLLRATESLSVCNVIAYVRRLEKELGRHPESPSKDPLSHCIRDALVERTTEALSALGCYISRN